MIKWSGTTLAGSWVGWWLICYTIGCGARSTSHLSALEPWRTLRVESGMVGRMYSSSKCLWLWSSFVESKRKTMLIRQLHESSPHNQVLSSIVRDYTLEKITTNDAHQNWAWQQNCALMAFGTKVLFNEAWQPTWPTFDVASCAAYLNKFAKQSVTIYSSSHLFEVAAIKKVLEISSLLFYVGNS